MSPYNLKLLAEVAHLQEESKLPVLIAGDLNIVPGQIQRSDYHQRSSIVTLAPTKPTHYKGKTAKVFDYFLGSQCVADLVQSVTVDVQAPMAPHRPVVLRAQLSGSNLVPMLETPQRLPTRRPYGPTREPEDWSEVHRLFIGLREVLTRGTVSSSTSASASPRAVQGWEKQQMLDLAHDQLACKLESQIASATDTVLRSPGSRSKPPIVSWIPARTKCRFHRKSWHLLSFEYRWIINQLQSAQRALHTSDYAALPTLLEDLEEPPAFFRSVSELQHQLGRLKQLVQSMSMDAELGQLDQPLCVHACSELQRDLEDGCSTARARARARQL